MGDEVIADCWNCDTEFIVIVEAGELSIKDDETCENRCPWCRKEQDMEVEYEPNYVTTSPVPSMQTGVGQDG